MPIAAWSWTARSHSASNSVSSAWSSAEGWMTYAASSTLSPTLIGMIAIRSSEMIIFIGSVGRTRASSPSATPTRMFRSSRPGQATASRS